MLINVDEDNGFTEAALWTFYNPPTLSNYKMSFTLTSCNINNNELIIIYNE